METAPAACFCDWKLVNEHINMSINCLLLIQLDILGLLHVPCGCSRDEGTHTAAQSRQSSAVQSPQLGAQWELHPFS